jgi:K(+)-stimulated pyrophosphate-energized sodium pump
LIKVMNLVALLIAPLVVEHTDDTALRAGIVIVAVVVLGAMIWVSKNRGSGLEADLEKAKAGTTTAA